MKKNLLILFVFITFQMQAQCWETIATGTHHNLAIKQDGTLWSWGNNDHWQLGRPTIPVTIPVQIGTDNDWAFIAAGEFSSMAIKQNGTLWVWGSNYSGQLGDGTTSGIQFPTQLGIDTDWKYISCKADHTAAIKTNGTLWTWGDNSYVQLGNGTLTANLVPQQVGADTDWKTVSASYYSTIALKNNGTLWAWGTNAGMFGNGLNPAFGDDDYYYYIPTQIGTETDWDKIATGGLYVLALKTDGTLWSWGDNTDGQLGDGTTNPRYLPAQIGLDTWKYISCTTNDLSSFCAAIKSNGTLWTWGTNTISQLGDESNINSSVPITISIDTDWKTCSAGNAFAQAIKTDDSLFMWGSNLYGQFGNGTTYSSNVPLFISCEALSLDKFTANNIMIYPNPANDIINIQDTEGNSIENIIITDLNGKNLIQYSNNTLSKINISGLATGVYLLHLNSDNENKTFKFIKQ